MAESFLVDTPVSEGTSADARSDQQLIAAINHGDVAAFDALYSRYRHWVAGLAARFTGDNDSALDVLQETFLYLLRKFPGFRLTANFKTFLYPAVRNLSIAAKRKTARAQGDDPAALDQIPAPEPPSAATSLTELNTVLARLPEEHREVLLLRFVDGLTLAEIARATSAPLGTVKSRLHYALDTLRQDPRTKEFFNP
jgi:RNA polymerase sigma-70 factor (ECF subfamily)